MITLALTLICGISIALTLARDRLTQSKKHPRLGKAITRAQPALIGVLLAAVVALGWPVVATSPALILYLAMPLVGWLFYGFKEWRLRNPGRLSYMLAGTLSGALGTLAGRRRRRKPYTMSESQKQRVKKLPEKPRSYWGVIFPSWVSLVLHTDKPIWCILSQVTVLLGALTALNLPTSAVPALAYYLGPITAASLTFYRWRSVDKVRQLHSQSFYGVASEKFGYEKAAKSSKVPDSEKFAVPHEVVKVRWENLTTPHAIKLTYPVEWKITDQRAKDDFAEHWETTFQSDTVKKFLWDTAEHTVSIIPANYPENIRWDGKTLGEWHRFTVGRYLETGEEAIFSVTKNAPHILVAGETGGGKSELMFNIVGQWCKKGGVAGLADPKATGWVAWTRNFRYTNEYGPDTGAAPLQPGDARPGIIEHAVELYGIFDVIKRTWDEVTRRKNINSKYGVSNTMDLPDDIRAKENCPPYLLVVDEALSLFAIDKGTSKEIQERNAIRGEILSYILRIIVEARAMGVHIMLGFQRPDTKYMDGSARDNTGIRMAAGYMKPQGLQMMFDLMGDVPKLPLKKDGAPDEVVKGRGQVRMGSGQPVLNVQYYWCGPDAADLDKYLPMPEGERTTNAPTVEVDTHIGENTLMVSAEQVQSILSELQSENGEIDAAALETRVAEAIAGAEAYANDPQNQQGPAPQAPRPTPAPQADDTPPAPVASSSFVQGGDEQVPLPFDAGPVEPEPAIRPPRQGTPAPVDESAGAPAGSTVPDKNPFDWEPEIQVVRRNEVWGGVGQGDVPRDSYLSTARAGVPSPAPASEEVVEPAPKPPEAQEVPGESAEPESSGGFF